MISSLALSSFSWVFSCFRLPELLFHLFKFFDHFFVLAQLYLNSRTYVIFTQKYVIFNDILFVTSSNFECLYNRFYFMAFLNFALCKIAMRESVSTNRFQQSCLWFCLSAAGLSICFGLFSPNFRRLSLLLSWFRPGRVAILSEPFLQMINSRSLRSTDQLWMRVILSLFPLVSAPQTFANVGASPGNSLSQVLLVQYLVYLHHSPSRRFSLLISSRSEVSLSPSFLSFFLLLVLLTFVPVLLIIRPLSRTCPNLLEYPNSSLKWHLLRHVG